MFFNKLKDNLKIILYILTICFFISIVIIIFHRDNKYLASSTILLKNNNSEDISNITNNEFNTYKEIIKNHSFYNNLNNSLNTNIDDKEFSNSINILKSSKSNTIKIQYKNEVESNAIKALSEILVIFNKELDRVYGLKLMVIEEPYILKKVSDISPIAVILFFILLGIILSLIYILFLIINELRINNIKQINEQLSLKALAQIPFNNNPNKIMSLETNTSKRFKEINQLKTTIQFINFDKRNQKSLLIVSPLKEEGKSYIAANLAVSYAIAGKKVVLVDANINNGILDKLFNLPNEMGFSNYLSGIDSSGIESNQSINKYINETSIKNLNIITKGTKAINTKELLTDNSIKQLFKDLRVYFDIIIIDGTEIINNTDSLILTKISDSTLIVARKNKTKKEDLDLTRRDIQISGGKIVGVVLNEIKTNLIILKLIKFRIYAGNVIKKVHDNLIKIKEKIEIIIEKRRKVKLLPEPASEKKLELPNEVENANEKQEYGINAIENNIKIDDNIEIPEKNIELNITPEENVILPAENEENINPNIGSSEKLIETQEVLNSIENKDKTKNKAYTTEEKIELNMMPNEKQLDEYRAPEVDLNEVIAEDNILEENDIVNNIGLKEYEEMFNQYLQDDNTILVIVDLQNAYCRLFNKNLFIEKKIESGNFDESAEKIYYSRKIVEKYNMMFQTTYGLTIEQVRRIDVIIYSILKEYDYLLWNNQKIESHKAEIYVEIMSRNYEKQLNETQSEYDIRVKRLRKIDLAKANIDIEYLLDNPLKFNKINLIGKLLLRRYANIFEIQEKYKSDFEIMKTRQNIEFYQNIFYGNEIITANKGKHSLEEEENSIEELLKRIKEDNEKELDKEDLLDFEKIEKFKKEKERIDKIEKKKAKIAEEREKKNVKKEERLRNQQLLKEQKEFEKEKLKEEARIEEELLIDNLYPKTKFNKSL